MAASDRRGCIFCGSGDLTVEDVVPKGIARLYKTEGSVKRTTVAGHQEGERRNYGMAFKVRNAVCRECNNGWMSGLQREAQPILKLLLPGDRPLLITPPAQRLLVAWLTMTAMVTEWHSDRSPPPVYSRAEREALRLDKQVPLYSAAWLAQRVATRDPAVDYSTKYLRVTTELSQPKRHNGQSFTAVLSRCVLQLCFRRAEPGFPWGPMIRGADGPWQQFVIGMPQAATVVWPPPLPLSEKGRAAFTERWKTPPPAPLPDDFSAI